MSSLELVVEGKGHGGGGGGRARTRSVPVLYRPEFHFYAGYEFLKGFVPHTWKGSKGINHGRFFFFFFF